MYFPGYLFSFHDLFQCRAVNENGAHNKMIIAIVNAADRIKGIIYPQKSNWFDKNNILLYVSHNTSKISSPSLVNFLEYFNQITENGELRTIILIFSKSEIPFDLF